MLEKKITDNLQQAMKEGRKIEVSALRMLLSSIKNKKIEDRVEELEDDKILAIIKKMVKQYKESMEQFTAGGREDLVEKESEELKVIAEYMPEEMAEDQIKSIVDQVISEMGASSPQDMGQVMKGVMAKTHGQADGKVISEMVKAALSK